MALRRYVTRNCKNTRDTGTLLNIFVRPALIGINERGWSIQIPRMGLQSPWNDWFLYHNFAVAITVWHWSTRRLFAVTEERFRRLRQESEHHIRLVSTHQQKRKGGIIHDTTPADAAVRRKEGAKVRRSLSCSSLSRTDTGTPHLRLFASFVSLACGCSWRRATTCANSPLLVQAEGSSSTIMALSTPNAFFTPNSSQWG